MIALDTNVLVHAVNPVPNGPDEAGSPEARARYLLADLREEGREIIIPSLVVAELLCFYKDDNDMKQREDLLSQLLVVPVDTAAARLAARLYRSFRRENGQDPGRRKGEVVRHDALVVATAELNGAEVLYTEDMSHFSPLAVDLKIEIREIPQPEKPLLPGVLE